MENFFAGETIMLTVGLSSTDADMIIFLSRLLLTGGYMVFLSGSGKKCTAEERTV